VRRDFVDRLHSLFAPVRRFRCRGIECGLEITLPKTHTVQRRSLLAFGALVATLAGALVTGGILYTMSDPPTRSNVLDGYVSVEPSAGRVADNLTALPIPQFIVDLQSDSALHIDPLSLPTPGEIALGTCERTPTGECSTSTVSSPARPSGYRK
jgi:hypothetical protein